jgi:protein TonB
MFDLVTDTNARPLRESSPTSRVLSMTSHAMLILVVIVIPLLQAANELPPVVPTMLAFVAVVPPAAPPPPPPPPRAPAASAPTEPVRTSGGFAAPITAPSDIQAERVQASVDATAGVLGGVEGGVPGGVVGGIVGGIVVSPMPPPPSPPPPPLSAVVQQQPVRIGGQITAPALLHRVEPVYPDVAARAHITGIVILEARVNTDGCVDQVTVLRTRHAMLNKAAEQALMQWRYSPLVLNGIPTPFVLTVTFNFSTE